MGDDILPEILGKLRKVLQPHIFHSLVEASQFEHSDERTLLLTFPDNFSRESFEERCLPALKEILKSLELDHMDVNLALNHLNATPIATPHSHHIPQHPSFDVRYSFDTFVVGRSNQFAHAACQAVSEQPGLSYNPLFIFGDAGLGKTHLLKAIGYQLQRNQPNLKIFYLTCESFTNELIHAIQVHNMRDFRNKYRSECDVLLIDDVHFMAGKDRTQEEFFYTFNYLHELRKQIIVTSDRYPKDIQGLENRLQTRFEWGLVADIQPPDVETRIAILRNKADVERISLPDDVAQYIATNVTQNIRELEGSLRRLHAYASLTGVPLTMDLAAQVLKDLSPKSKHVLTPDAILKLVAIHFNVRTFDLRSDKRTRKLTFPRQMCMYLLRKHLAMSFPKIGHFMGGKDHTTVMHAVEKIATMQGNHPEVLNHITAIDSLIR